MRCWRVVLLLCVVLPACTRVGDEATAETSVVETTVRVTAENLGPGLEEIPTSPDTVVEIGPGPDSLTETHLDQLTLIPGYEEGSARVEGVYRSDEGPLHLISWRKNDLTAGGLPMTCRAVVPPDGHIDVGCGSSDSSPPPKGISGMSYHTDPGDNTIEVEHTRGATATVIELRDGTVHLIRPGDSAISYNEWHGAPPVRVTVFWPDGFTAEVLTD